MKDLGEEDSNDITLSKLKSALLEPSLILVFTFALMTFFHLTNNATHALSKSFFFLAPHSRVN